MPLCPNSSKVSFFPQELSELVHKVHLLCLLARGRLIDSACNDPFIQVISSITSFCSILSLCLFPYYFSHLVALETCDNTFTWFYDNYVAIMLLFFWSLASPSTLVGH